LNGNKNVKDGVGNSFLCTQTRELNFAESNLLKNYTSVEERSGLNFPKYHNIRAEDVE
jgi:hypothetical protein